MDLNEFLQIDTLNKLKMLMNIRVLYPERECLNCKCKCALMKRCFPEKYSKALAGWNGDLVLPFSHLILALSKIKFCDQAVKL
ncbi:hypothetical protein BpHYR1_039217 [Brachionus plicatilis]|uniref:Uncharacterized protein n=1 Tax=Brachionus plicatilis TaxID=10195 RepID=A0A3M7QWG0_BRAPC|nr:hypothetical protein BpHYR1_039217 [Brachionus plicatilis]